MPGVDHPARFIPQRHRLGPAALAAACPHADHRQADVGGGQRGRDHVAALVGLCHHPVGVPACRRRRHRPRPHHRRRAGDAGILHHRQAAIGQFRRHDDAARIAARGGGRVHPDHHPHRGADGIGRDPAAVKQRVTPQPALRLCQHFAVQLLPRQPGAAIQPVHRRHPPGGQIGGVGGGAPLSDRHAIFGQQAAQQRHRARGGGRHHLRAAAQPQ